MLFVSLLPLLLRWNQCNSCLLADIIINISLINELTVGLSVTEDDLGSLWCWVCDHPLRSMDNVMSDKHTISNPNHLLSSPHSGGLIVKESAFNFCLSRLAEPSCPSDPPVSLCNGIFQGEKDTHTHTQRKIVSRRTPSTHLLHREGWFDEFLSWKSHAWNAPGSSSTTHSFFHLNMINLLCRMLPWVNHLHLQTVFSPLHNGNKKAHDNNPQK